ncbi:hypothetical protein HQ865_06320 [Mucilaginibacter mali]|uniref:TonB-dependent receptor plug domain-containing protein n=1 Tax=Mucilaginibacter mali TaxID=2740462 RepID=A0A7D4Q7Z3_9SPHI|nr:hypothetical protein [Mucilaginibacter mali]QKJ29385.1 hypothetical protein HQ865_06320 [Mucilaginibacter mali]
MKKKRLIALLFILPFLLLLAFRFKDSPLDKLLASLEKLTAAYPQEKVHLHFDKPFYSLGEDVWFKAYVVNAEKNHLSNHSQILYVDMIDDRDSVCNTLLLPMINGMAIGNLHLSDTTFKAGNYHIYAYTKWMSNFSSDYYFRKDIQVVNAIGGAICANMEYKANAAPTGKQINAQIIFKKDNTTPISNQQVSYTVKVNDKTITDSRGTTNNDGLLNVPALIKDEYKTANVVINASFTTAKGQTITRDFVIKPLAQVANIQFFPEGGHLVDNLRTKVGFKALKPNGLGEDISGYIADEKNEHVAEFKSEHAGMGVFALMPQTGKTYTAVIKHEDGSEKRYALPKAEAQGYILNINHIGSDSLSVRVASSATLVNGKEMYIVGQSNGVVQFAAKTRMDRASNLSYITAKNIPTGIIQFTLFSAEMTPLAERLVFINHNDYLRSVIKPDKEVYSKRGKVNMDITVTDAGGQPISGNFSVSVTDEGKVKPDENNETSILSNLLLTSDIKGYIEQPNYYFNPQNPDRQKHLDQLLLTQGWRRFNWADVLTNKFPQIIYQPEENPSIGGKIVNLMDKPVPHGKVTLFASKGDNTIIIDTVADENGHFVFRNLHFTDTVRATIRATDQKDRKNVKIVMDRKPIIQSASPYGVFANPLANSNLNEYIKATQSRFIEMNKFGLFKNVVPLKEVKIVAQKTYTSAKVVPNSVNPNPGSADRVITQEKIGQESGLLMALYGISNISVKKGGIFRIGHTNRLQNNTFTPKAVKGGIAMVSTADPDTQSQPMMIMLDGARIQLGDLMEIPTDGIAAIEILTSETNTAIFGNDGYWGVILITSKRGGEGLVNIPLVNVSKVTARGYSVTKEFYAPAYDAPSEADKMTDLRSTIYWNPDLVTDVQGKTNFSYFNADGEGTYKVTLEGMDFRGNLLRKTLTYIVK